VNKPASENKTIRAFAKHLIKKELPLSPSKMADEFLFQ